MKKLTVILPVMIMLFLGSVLAQESDYEIVEEFKINTDQLELKIQNAITTTQIQLIEQELDSLEQAFDKHSTIINHAIYPTTYSEEIETLRAALINNEHRLYLIENQREQLFDLSNQVMAHRAEINRLYTQVDSLNQEITYSQASEARLSELVSNYRKSVEERDRLLFGMIDSLLVTHQKIQSSTKGEQPLSTYTIEDRNNPLGMIQHLIDRNIEATQANNAMLSVNDHLRMRALQVQFERTWDQIKDDFIAIYGEPDEQWEARIDTSLKQWRMIASQKMWQSVDQYLTHHQIEVDAFDNTQSFYSAMDTFIAEGHELSKEEFLVSDSYQQFVEFEKFWNETFKTRWMPKMPEGVLLNEEQITTIDVAITNWEETARPIHPMLAALLALTVVSLTGFVLVMFKSGKASKKG